MPSLHCRPLLNALLVPLLCASLFADNPSLFQRVSESSSGAQGNDSSGSGFGTLLEITEDGRFTAFTSFATNLVAGDTNGQKDVFVHDRTTGTTIRASLGSAGQQSNGRCDNVGVSADGRYVVYMSEADNLVSLDFNARRDVFLFDRTFGTSRIVSMGPGGFSGNGSSESPSISADGRFVCFWSSASDLVPGDTNGVGDIFVWDRVTDQTQRVSTDTFDNQGNGNCGRPHIARGGRYVVFESESSNLALADFNGLRDVFWKDTLTGQIFRIAGSSLQTNGVSRSPRVSADGRITVFESMATNLVSGDTNGVSDCFLFDVTGGGVERFSVATGGLEANNHSQRPSISADGQWIAFQSGADNLVPQDDNDRQDVFLRHRVFGWTERLSERSDGSDFVAFSNYPSVSSDGRFVAFLSTAAFVSDDTNGVHDVFVLDQRVSSSNFGYPYCDSNPNSTGNEAKLYAYQSPIIEENSLVLEVDDLPPNQAGYMLMSDTQAFVPLFGGSQGNLCLGGNILRFSATVLDTGIGMVDFALDFYALPQGTMVQPGQSWNFQFWFRDGNPGNTSNTSDGLCVTLH